MNFKNYPSCIFDIDYCMRLVDSSLFEIFKVSQKNPKDDPGFVLKESDYLEKNNNYCFYLEKIVSAPVYKQEISKRFLLKGDLNEDPIKFRLPWDPSENNTNEKITFSLNMEAMDIYNTEDARLVRGCFRTVLEKTKSTSITKQGFIDDLLTLYQKEEDAVNKLVSYFYESLTMSLSISHRTTSTPIFLLINYFINTLFGLNPLLRRRIINHEKKTKKDLKSFVSILLTEIFSLKDQWDSKLFYYTKEKLYKKSRGKTSGHPVGCIMINPEGRLSNIILNSVSFLDLPQFKPIPPFQKVPISGGLRFKNKNYYLYATNIPYLDTKNTLSLSNKILTIESLQKNSFARLSEDSGVLKSIDSIRLRGTCFSIERTLAIFQHVFEPVYKKIHKVIIDEDLHLGTKNLDLTESVIKYGTGLPGTIGQLDNFFIRIHLAKGYSAGAELNRTCQALGLDEYEKLKKHVKCFKGILYINNRTTYSLPKLDFRFRVYLLGLISVTHTKLLRILGHPEKRTPINLNESLGVLIRYSFSLINETQIKKVKENIPKEYQKGNLIRQVETLIKKNDFDKSKVILDLVLKIPLNDFMFEERLKFFAIKYDIENNLTPIIEFDAVASGCQVKALLLGDKELMKKTNLIGGTPQDPYEALFDFKAIENSLTTDKEIKWFKQFRQNRKARKFSLMVISYNAKSDGVSKEIIRELSLSYKEPGLRSFAQKIINCTMFKSKKNVDKMKRLRVSCLDTQVKPLQKDLDFVDDQTLYNEILGGLSVHVYLKQKVLRVDFDMPPEKTGTLIGSRFVEDKRTDNSELKYFLPEIEEISRKIDRKVRFKTKTLSFFQEDLELLKKKASVLSTHKHTIRIKIGVLNSHNVSKRNTSFDANFVHQLDSALLMRVSNDFHKKWLMTIHDAFLVEASDCGLIQKSYNEALVNTLKEVNNKKGKVLGHRKDILSDTFLETIRTSTNNLSF